MLTLLLALPVTAASALSVPPPRCSSEQELLPQLDALLADAQVAVVVRLHQAQYSNTFTYSLLPPALKGRVSAEGPVRLGRCNRLQFAGDVVLVFGHLDQGDLVVDQSLRVFSDALDLVWSKELTDWVKSAAAGS